ncbi:dockerin type I domain-containing protein [Botrimarina sp.]|uniref:dockerin type I domain-containing protein n=1 Tax=Botrimarina sp. TaxID=2795802 RepID=UPI0032EF3E90
MRTPAAGLHALLFILAAAPAALGQVYINEIFFDPGGAGTDLRDEFIELRGAADQSLANHYLIFLENELDSAGAGEAGVIENIFDLGAYSLGANGFLTLQQKFNRYSGAQLVEGATHLVNEGPNKPGSGPSAFPGFGNNDPGAEGSTIGASDLVSGLDAPTTGAIENSGFTAMLIRNDAGEAPLLGFDLDEGNDGLDEPTGRPGWSILDSIGVFGEVDETEFGRLYAQVNFGVGDIFLPPGFTPNIPEGAEFELIEYEIEYIARWGNSTGQTTADWHVSNLTDNPGSGAAGVVDSLDGPVDFRQSGDPHPSDDGNPATPPPQPPRIESNRGAPYGTPLLTNIGGPNYLTGDYNGDGHADAADYTLWRDTLGQTGGELDPVAADANRDFRVDQQDYALWVANYTGAAPASPSGAAAPEPTAAVLLLAAIGLCVAGRR